MTEPPTSDHRDDADAAWFRSQVDPVVEGPVAPAWAEIDARLGQPDLASPTAGRGRRRAAVVLAAAALVLAAVGIGIASSDGDGDDPGRLETSDSTPGGPGGPEGDQTTTTIDPDSRCCPELSTTTTAADTVDPDDPTATPPGWMRSLPGEPMGDDHEPGGSWSDLTGLTLWLEVQTDGTLRPTQPAPARIAYLNATNEPIPIRECTDLLVRWGVLPVDGPDAPVARTITDCYGTEVAVVQPGEVVRRDLGGIDDPGFTARRYDAMTPTGGSYLGALDPGEHLAVAEVQGSMGSVRMELVVTVQAHPCGLTDELVLRYLGTTEAEAKALAEADGYEVRVIERDGQRQGHTDDLRCDRIDLDVGREVVFGVDRY